MLQINNNKVVFRLIMKRFLICCLFLVVPLFLQGCDAKLYVVLYGDPYIKVGSNTEFVDPGAEVRDAKEKDQVVSTSPSTTYQYKPTELSLYKTVPSLDTSKVGFYKITYNFSNGRGANATPKERVVEVVPNNEEEITLLGNAKVTIAKNAAFVDPGVEISRRHGVALQPKISYYFGDVRSDTLDSSKEGNHVVLYELQDGTSFNAKPVKRIVQVDGQPPFITMLGPNKMTLTFGQPFVDPGLILFDGRYSATYSKDGQPIAKIDSNVPGTYTVHYEAVDGVGNRSVATRTVIVSPPPDVTAPVITLLGDSVTHVTYGAAFQDPGVAAVDDTDPVTVVAVTYMRDGQSVSAIDTHTLGNYTIRYDAKDAAGNAAETKTRTVVVFAPVRLEAEASVNQLVGNARTEFSFSNVTSGGGNVGFLTASGDGVTFVNTPQAVRFELRYSSPGSSKADIRIGDRIVEVELPPTGSYSSYGSVTLMIVTQLGDRVSVLRGTTGDAFNIDFLEFYPY
ncbi:DUF5011 domain-containing protein [Paenibacillus sp. TRM 82003]|nr:DUF5011 domain-containing protein [Paenibacillus sp. TRM 82003]